MSARGERRPVLDEAFQDQGIGGLDRKIKLRCRADRGHGYFGKLAQAVALLSCRRTRKSDCQPGRHKLSRYLSCVGCSRTFFLMNSRMRRNSSSTRLDGIRSVAGDQLSGTTPSPVKIACQLSGRNVSSSMGAISPRARNVAILWASAAGKESPRAFSQKFPSTGDKA